MMTWIEETIAALCALGGQATYPELYGQLRRTTTKRIPRHFEALVRATVEAHSSDSANFRGRRGGPRDLFYSVAGKGKGRWGLRPAAAGFSSKERMSVAGGAGEGGPHSPEGRRARDGSAEAVSRLEEATERCVQVIAEAGALLAVLRRGGAGDGPGEAGAGCSLADAAVGVARVSSALVGLAECLEVELRTRPDQVSGAPRRGEAPL